MRKKYGFTLIELLVVIAVIGLLASVVLVTMGGTRAKARDSRRISDITQLQKAIELYWVKYEDVPSQTVYGEGNATIYFDISTEDKDGNGIFFLDPLVLEGFIGGDMKDPVNDYSKGYYYRYWRNTSDSCGCGSKHFSLIAVTESGIVNTPHPCVACYAGYFGLPTQFYSLTNTF